MDPISDRVLFTQKLNPLKKCQNKAKKNHHQVSKLLLIPNASQFYYCRIYRYLDPEDAYNFEISSNKFFKLNRIKKLNVNIKPERKPVNIQKLENQCEENPSPKNDNHEWFNPPVPPRPTTPSPTFHNDSQLSLFDQDISINKALDRCERDATSPSLIDSRIELLIERGIEFFNQKNFSEAENLLMQSYRYFCDLQIFNPSYAVDPNLLFFLFRVKLYRHKYHESHEFLIQAEKKILSASAEVIADVARLYFALEKLHVSETFFTLALKKCFYNNPCILVDAAYCEMRIDKINLALKYFYKTASLFLTIGDQELEEKYLFFIHTAKGLALCGRKIHSHEFFSSIINRMDELKIELPDNVVMEFVESKINIGLYKEAYDFLWTKIQLFKGNVPSSFILLETVLKSKLQKYKQLPPEESNQDINPSSNSYETLLELATAAYNNGRFNEANDYIPLLLSKFINSPVPYNLLLGCSLIKIVNHEYVQADEYLSLVLKKQRNPIVLSCAARVKFELGNFEKAENLLSQALSFYKVQNLALAEINYLNAYFKFKRYIHYFKKKVKYPILLKEAELSLQYALAQALHDELDYKFIFKSSYLLGRVKLFANQIEEADAIFNNIDEHEQFSKWSSPLIDLYSAISKFILKQYDKADELFANALQNIDCKEHEPINQAAVKACDIVLKTQVVQNIS